MNTITLPNNIWYVINNGKKVGEATTRKQARDMKASLKRAGSTRVVIARSSVIINTMQIDSHS